MVQFVDHAKRAYSRKSKVEGFRTTLTLPSHMVPAMWWNGSEGTGVAN
jgi:hypothetical protein